MKIIEILEKFKKAPAFSLHQLEQQYPNFERENLLNWQKKGYIIRIRNGWYSVKDRILSEEHLYWVANKIYWPSYISLETAFSYYGWIPEAVFTLTSISTQKTQVFDTPVGQFRYASIKASLFFGYRLLYHEGYGIKIAEPEKALLDFLYLYPHIASVYDFEGLRLNLEKIKSDIDIDKFKVYCSLYHSVALSERVQTFQKHLYHAELV